MILTLFATMNVHANTIYDIDMDIYIDKDATATIKEKWHVKGSNGTEWYKPLKDLGKSELYDYEVLMDDKPLKEKKWNVKENISQKKGYYGINYSNGDTELCFGKGDFQEHTFTLKYKLSNFIFNTTDAQVLYWTLFPKFQNVNFQKVHVKIASYYKFPDTLDVWGFGYKGYYYAKDGIIEMSNEENSSMNDQYLVALVKFPKETFNTNYKVNNFTTFDDVLTRANKDTFTYDYGNGNSNNNSNGYSRKNRSIFSRIWNIISNFGVYILAFLGIGVATKKSLSHGYGYKDNKKIDKENVHYFRDIPCDKNIYYANALIYLNNFGFNETNILGAIILKWVKEEKVKFLKKQSRFLKKEIGCIDLTLKPTFTNPSEEELFHIMYEASGDGILEPKEFEKWARRNYSSFFDIFKAFKDKEIRRLESEQHIYKRKDKNECKRLNVMDDTIYEESTRLYGLKKFLQDFSSIDTKETLEVHLWDEYLMFAYLFGIADKVAKQIKHLYPDLLEQNNIDFDTLIIINNISTSTAHAASSARSNAENYHGGGGGFSIGGGGGGSFGGGGFSGGGSR